MGMGNKGPVLLHEMGGPPFVALNYVADEGLLNSRDKHLCTTASPPIEALQNKRPRRFLSGQTRHRVHSDKRTQ